MKSSLQQRILWPVLMACLAAVLIALGLLQYRWSNEVSNAASARMRAVLSTSMLDFQRDLMREISMVASAFPNEERGASPDLPSYADSIRQWETANSHAGMVQAIYVTERRPGGAWRILRFDSSKSSFAETAWPPELAGLRDSILGVAVTRFGDHDPPPQHGERRGPPMILRDHRRFRGPGELAHRGPPWFLDSSIPALVRPLGMFAAQHSPEDRHPGGIIIELNPDFLAQHLFPELAQRYFPNSDALGYDVTVLAGQRESLYSSSGRLTGADADASLDLLGPSGPHPLNGPLPHFRSGPDMPPATARLGDTAGGAPLVLVGMHHPEGNWQLLVRNRQGSLEAVVDRLRRRNLAISFGILLVLAATMAMLIRTSRSALRLAQLQMDFVAGVSHELRTPVTVISSAAENIADGVVQDKEQLARYGNVIRTQATQLRQLIEQILQFASIRRSQSRYDLRPAGIEGIVEIALENTSELIRSAGFRAETSIQPGLPAVMADPQALSQALQNLITNAVKYGGEAGWIGISAAVRQTVRGSEVLLTVADRGIGIAPDELKEIFNPFYRGTDARAAQIHGSGLGLPLAKSMVEAMGGEITVESRPGEGSSFTIHLPVSAASTSKVNVTAPVNPKASYSKS